METTEGVLAEKAFLTDVATRRGGTFFHKFARVYLQGLARRYWSFGYEQRPLQESERAAIEEHVRRLVASGIQ
jgi:hypothetical protein